MASEEPVNLLKEVAAQASELAAINILLKAIIASHPKPGDLKRALQMLSANFVDQARDHAFETGREPKVIGSVTSDVQKYIDRWLHILANVPASNL
jgi:hypothetical protein